MSHPAGVAVIGGSVAGGSVVRELRAAGFTGPVTVVDPDPDHPYDRPPLSKEFLASAEPRPEALWWDERCSVLHTRAVGLDRDMRAVETLAADGSRAWLQADQVVLATGAHPIRLPQSPDGILQLRTAEDARALRALAGSQPTVAIIGAGAIGTELASSLNRASCHVDLIDLAPQPLQRMFAGHLGDEASAWIRESGVELHLGWPLLELRRNGATWVVATETSRVSADLVVSAVGVRPEVGWLESAGLDCPDGVRCDNEGTVLSRSGEPIPWLHAVGDVAAWRGTDGAFRRHEDWTSAQRQARRVALRTLGLQDLPGDDDGLPYFWTQQFGRRIQILGAPDPHGRLTQLSANPDRQAAFYSVEGAAGDTTAWVAINEPRMFALALREQRATCV